MATDLAPNPILQVPNGTGWNWAQVEVRFLGAGLPLVEPIGGVCAKGIGVTLVEAPLGGPAVLELAQQGFLVKMGGGLGRASGPSALAGASFLVPWLRHGRLKLLWLLRLLV